MPAGTWPANPGSTGVMPYARMAARMGPPGLHITHSVPRKEGGARKVRPDLLLRQAQGLEHVRKDFFLPIKRQGQVHALQRHPVNHVLPLLCRVPGKGVARGAHVPGVAPLHGENGARGRGQGQ
ncbi:hypothetical protein C9890_0382 [Perkinsus sp. BL_2016]|nr:hypothetical protein C9890_0382 [Perkinsus sp. BL_2016]